MTAQEIFDRAMALLDEVSTRGVPVSSTDLADYKLKAPNIINLTLNELAHLNEDEKTFETSHKPVPNQIGDAFTLREYKGEDVVFKAKGSKGYFFEVDGAATIFIEEETAPDTWDILEIVNNTGYNTHKNTITASDANNQIRLRFSGSTYYTFKNIFLTDILFAEVPEYRPYFKISMPDDFQSTQQIIEEYPFRNYIETGFYKWEGRRDLYVNWNFEGTIRILYKPVPVAVTDLADTVDFDERTLVPVSYKLAGEIALYEERGNANYFFDKFEELKTELFKKSPDPEKPANNYYGDFSADDGISINDPFARC